MRILYRIRQFWYSLTAIPTSEDIARLDGVLSKPLMELFSTLQPGEQVHGLQIYHKLLEQGETNCDLLAAALLHDVGKNRYPLRIWQRVIIVLGKSLFSDHVKRWSLGDPGSWRRPFVVADKHADWGSEMAVQAGASTTTVKLIQHHHDPLRKSPIEEDDLLLNRLQLLDDRC